MTCREQLDTLQVSLVPPPTSPPGHPCAGSRGSTLSQAGQARHQQADVQPRQPAPRTCLVSSPTRRDFLRAMSQACPCLTRL